MEWRGEVLRTAIRSMHVGVVMRIVSPGGGVWYEWAIYPTDRHGKVSLTPVAKERCESESAAVSGAEAWFGETTLVRPL